MARVISFGEAGPQDPIYGINRKNIVKQLTVKNWQKKAIVRGGYYVWVALGSTRAESGDKAYRYYVRVYLAGDHKRDLERDFAELDAALAYANKLFPEQWPLTVDSQAPYVIGGTFTGRPRKSAGSAARPGDQDPEREHELGSIGKEMRLGLRLQAIADPALVNDVICIRRTLNDAALANFELELDTILDQWDLAWSHSDEVDEARRHELDSLADSLSERVKAFCENTLKEEGWSN